MASRSRQTVGLVSSFLSLLHSEEEAVSHIAVAFDNPIRSFRNELFDGYKTGEGIDPELARPVRSSGARQQRRWVSSVWPMARYEADDGAGHGGPPLCRSG